jgi:hypothetical protein
MILSGKARFAKLAQPIVVEHYRTLRVKFCPINIDIADDLSYWSCMKKIVTELEELVGPRPSLAMDYRPLGNPEVKRN